ncbi:antA/AntB antirepressor family protein [Brevibacterium sp. p3-SID960]|uniref:antA/AntB antirepressor family protein n=1 Tax=Brevibacterium sp. p3-SID960 TaxID=2916063 RepID=UPI0021A6C34E|nr:antA/AntB antirepressor family protein [Brevibacterium sp. p3-SID960]MCT1689910.1 antA/AntB antirepressor family protein [Brevibacterium sp. p3-SID960]
MNDSTSIEQLIPIRDHEGQRVASGRAIHAYLGVQSNYTTWFARMVDYGFVEGQDFLVLHSNSGKQVHGGSNKVDHAVTIDMAKELGMIQRTPKGKEIRQYFIAVEKQRLAPTPELVSRADLARMVLEAEEEKKVLEAALESAAPAIEYHDRYVSDGDVVKIEDWGRQYQLRKMETFKLLRDKNIIFKHSYGWYWSNSQQKQVEEYEYRARQGRQTYAYFEQRPHHKVSRMYNGQVRQTLYVRQAHAIDLAKACGLVQVKESA